MRQISFHSAGVTGWTDRRVFFTSTISAKRGSFAGFVVRDLTTNAVAEALGRAARAARSFAHTEPARGHRIR